MERREEIIPARLRRAGTIVIAVIAASWVIFLLVTIFAKPVYTPFGALGIIMGAIAITTVLAGVLLLVDYRGKEGKQ